MQKKEKEMKWWVLALLLITFIILIVANILVIIKFSKITTKVTSASQGTIYLYIEGQVTPTPTSAPEVPGPGGGGVSAKAVYDFEIDQTLIKIMTKKGETFKTSFKVKNIEKVKQDFEIDLGVLKEHIIASETSFSLNAGEEKTIFLTFFTTIDDKEGVYTGTITISTASKKKELPVIFEVKSKIILFDISLDIPSKYKELLPGEELLIQLTLFNLGELGKTDVKIETLVKDFEGKEILKQEDTVAVEIQTSFSRTIKLPSDIKPGDYVAVAYVRYGTSFGTSSDTFHVISEKIVIKTEYIIFIAVAVLIIFTIALNYYWNRKLKRVAKMHTKEIASISEKMRYGMKAAEAIKLSEKLKLQLQLLNRAYEKGFISKQAYDRGKERLNNLYVNLKKKYL